MPQIWTNDGWRDAGAGDVLLAALLVADTTHEVRGIAHELLLLPDREGEQWAAALVVVLNLPGLEDRARVNLARAMASCLINVGDPASLARGEPLPRADLDPPTLES